MPGLSDPTRLLRLLQTTAKMTFQLVDESADVTQAQKGIVPIGDELLELKPGRKGIKPPPIVVQKRVMVAGDRLIDAQAAFDQQTGQPDVTFKFDSVGAREFGDVTKDNVGRRFAIVLDKKVITDPTIQQVILGGLGPDHGQFHDAGCQRSGGAAACRRAACALEADQPAHRGRDARRRLHRRRQILDAGRALPRGPVHGRPLRAVRGSSPTWR